MSELPPEYDLRRDDDGTKEVFYLERIIESQWPPFNTRGEAVGTAWLDYALYSHAWRHDPNGRLYQDARGRWTVQLSKSCTVSVHAEERSGGVGPAVPVVSIQYTATCSFSFNGDPEGMRALGQSLLAAADEAERLAAERPAEGD